MPTPEAVRRGAGTALRAVLLAALGSAPALAQDGAPPAPQDPKPPAAPEETKPPAAPPPAPPAEKAPEPKPPAEKAPGEKAPAEKPAGEKPTATPTAEPPKGTAAPPPAAPAPAPDDGRSDLRAAVEDTLGAPVHGRFSVRYQIRTIHEDEDEDETDQDLTSYLDLGIGDERRDRLSANFHVRTAWDLDSAHEDEDQGYVFSSLADTFDHEFTALLDTAYATWRPAAGGGFGDAVEAVRVGRQYEYVAETFHFDGASFASRPFAGARRLTVRAYAGIPVHFYEPSSSGDVVAGVQAAAETWECGRAALDYAHVEDELSGFGEESDDLAAAQVWHALGAGGELHGRFTWLDGPSDVSFRGTVDLEEHDLLLQGSLYRLLEEKEEQTTELDPYYTSLHVLERYWLGELRASKGFGEHWRVEVGGYLRELDDDVEESDYNRNTRRFWITPSVDDLVAEGSTLSAGLELWTGDGERIETWVADYSHRFSKDVRAYVGTDYSLYAYGPLQDGEREHVRSVYVRTRAQLTETLSLDLRYAWERDDQETYHVLSLALGVDF